MTRWYETRWKWLIVGIVVLMVLNGLRITYRMMEWAAKLEEAKRHEP